jgi:hypothetical protein
MSISSKETANHLAEILKELDSLDYLVNSFLRISKATPEQMKKYKIINARFPRILTLVYSLIGIPVGIAKVIGYVVASVFFRYQYRIYNSKPLNAEILFLSHAIGKNISKKDSDQFFARMPDYLNKKNKKISIVYTNHNIFGYRNNNKLLSLKSEGIDRHLIPKFLKPIEHFKYLTTVGSLSFKCLKYGLKKSFQDPIKSLLSIKSAIFFYNRSTYSNYLVAQRLKEYCHKRTINSLIMTFEGHSYEQYVIQEIKKGNPNVNIILYQHSPIVSDHFGVEQFLRTNLEHLCILTTGTLYESNFQAISLIPEFLVIGSDKAYSNHTESKKDFKSQVLFAPEGTILATFNFLKLINYLSSNYGNFKYVLRLHPNLKKNILLTIWIKKLNTKSNFSLSTESLYEDLMNSNFVFYRSSAVGIEALNSVAIPIFYGSSAQQGLNVLEKLSMEFPSASSPEQALSVLKTNFYDLALNERIKNFTKIYSKIDYEKLYSLLKI